MNIPPPPDASYATAWAICNRFQCVHVSKFVQLPLLHLTFIACMETIVFQFSFEDMLLRSTTISVTVASHFLWSLSRCIALETSCQIQISFINLLATSLRMKIVLKILHRLMGKELMSRLLSDLIFYNNFWQ